MPSKDEHIELQLLEEKDVSLLTETVRILCRSNLFDRIDTEQLVLACSEIGHNAIRHGLGGNANIYALKDGKLIRVIVSDSGPGIPNIELALREGYTTVKTSLGLGLEGAQRLVDNFNIDSSNGNGTIVTLEKYRPLTKNAVDYGLVSIPDNNYNYNGDQYVLKEYDGDALLLGVIDGPGQGYDAHSIAQTCKQFIENNYRKPITELLHALNILMQESNDDVGITCSLARITPHNITYGGLGDTHAYLALDKAPSKPLINQEGRIGYIHRVQTGISRFSFDHNVTIVMCSDGIKTIYDTIDVNMSAQDLANVLFDKNHRPNGDATIIIAKFNV